MKTRQASEEQAVADALFLSPAASIDMVVRGTGFRANRVRDILRRMERDGRVKSEWEDDWLLYRLVGTRKGS